MPMVKILAIDDKEDNLIVLSALLKNIFPKVGLITSKTGVDGLAKAEKELPDTILLDIKMPGMDGFEVCKKLKSNQATRHIPILLVTAIHTDIESRIKGLEQGADAFLTKPLNEAEFAAQVKAMLRLKKAEDILRTQNCLLEKMVDERTKQLKESEECYRFMAENVRDVIWISDLNFSLTYVSPSVVYLLGYRAEELIARRMDEILTPASFQQLIKIFNQELLDKWSRPKGLFHSLTLDLEHTPKNGGTIWTEVRISLMPESNNRPICVLGVTRDISERKRAEEHIRHHNEKLEELVRKRTDRIRELERQRTEIEKLAATGRMAARIAHEINNPLAGIKNCFLLIQDTIKADHPYYDYFLRIDREIIRITRIIHQMIDLYRPVPERARPFHLKELISHLVSLWKVSCRERKIEIEIDMDEKIDIVCLPETSLSQILFNIFQNALDASPDGGTIRISATSSHEKVCILVVDQGNGIPESIGSNIFEPFFSTKDTTSGSGLGLGLSISRNLAEGMGGTLDFQSQVGRGTVFRLLLPSSLSEN